MAQVAAGVIAPDAAAYHVVQHAGEGLNNAQPATAAEQLHQQLSATQVTPQEAGASGRGDSETANIPGQVNFCATSQKKWAHSRGLKIEEVSKFEHSKLALAFMGPGKEPCKVF